jgi:periplasmic protein TonB
MADMAIQLIQVDLQLPWVEGKEDRFFRRMAISLVILALILGFIINSVTLPEPKQRKLIDVAPRLAQLIQEKKKLPPPPPPKPKKKEVEKTKEKKKEPEKPKPKEKPKPEPKPDSRAAAKKKAQQSGLIALSDELSDLRESFDFSDIADLPQQKTGNQAETVVSTSDVLTAKATQGSGGIATNTLSRQIKESELAQRQTTSKVESKIASKAQVAKATTTKSRGANRSQEEIERVFQKNKGSIFNIYNRELRKDPTLQGKVVFELTIAPDGSVTSCVIVSSELGNKKLEKRLVSKIRKFKFANKKVPTIKVTYPIDFLPS